MSNKQLKPFTRPHLPLLVPVVGLILIVAMAVLAASMTLLTKDQNLGSKAAAATTLTMTTGSSSVSPNQLFTVNVDVNTNQNLVKAIDLGIKYDNQYLELIRVEKGAFAANGLEIINAINSAAGIASYSVVVPTTATPPYLTGQGAVAKVTFRAIKTTTSTQITFLADETTVGAQGETSDASSLLNNLTVAIADGGSITPVPTVPPNISELFIYSYEACMNTGSDGASTYIIWNNNRYPNIKSIDISTKADFSEYANKDVTNPKALANGYAMTDGTNFRWQTGSKSIFKFDPDVTYYVRLFYDNRHSAVTTYLIPKCSGIGGVTYKQCNESCGSNNECGANLYCYNNQCRRINNPNDSSCVMPPDKGIKRTCNEYCADSNECGDGLTCWYNRCRAPQKVEDQSCPGWAKPTTASCNKYCADTSECSDGLTCWYNRCRNSKNLNDTACRTSVQSGYVEGCNQTCSVNADCPANLRCYGNQCRLMSNPGSTTCQVPRQTSQNTTGVGGDNLTVQPTRRPTTKPTVAPTQKVSTSSATTTPSPVVTVKLNTSPSPKVSVKPAAKPTAVAKLVNDFPDKTDTTDTTSKKTSSPFAAVPLILGVIIVVVAALLGIPRLLAMLQSKSGQSLIAQQPPMQPMGGQPPVTQPTNQSSPTPGSSTAGTGTQGFGRPLGGNPPPKN